MKKTFLFILILAIFLVACGGDDEQQIPTLVPVAEVGGTDTDTAVSDSESVAMTPETIVQEEETAVSSTATPSEPLAALVNGQAITIAVYEQELARYEKGQAELGIETPEDNYQQIVLDALIEKLLITQAAEEQGIVVTPEMVEQQMMELRAVAGEAGNFEAWLEANNWTEEEFRTEIASGMLIEQMVALVTADVSATVEQVRARIIQLDDSNLANTLLTQINNGDGFAFLAQQYSLDAVTASEGGDLGFFAQGTLLVPEIGAAAFALPNPNDVSGVVSVVNENGSTTYYLVQLVERDPQRPLPADMQYLLYEETFQRWIDGLWQSATVERMIP